MEKISHRLNCLFSRPIGHSLRLSTARQHCIRHKHTTVDSTPSISPFGPRHLLSCADLSTAELKSLINNAYRYKQACKSGSIPDSLVDTLAGKIIALMFNKRSTRTRVSSESAVARLGGTTMFLGKDDIQLGVNESLRDTSTVISSMVHGIVARVAAHSDIQELVKYSTVPIINALSDDFHPLQALAHNLTLFETFTKKDQMDPARFLEGIKVAWVGDANNVLYDLAIAAGKLGIDISVATPKGYSIPSEMKDFILHSTSATPHRGRLTETHVPEEAVKGANVIVTDTWISMGQEAEKQKRLAAFDGFQVSSALAERGGAHSDWKFTHCLPRHQEEVTDGVFYDPARSLVWEEAENRLWTMLAVMEAFIVRQGQPIEG